MSGCLKIPPNLCLDRQQNGLFVGKFNPTPVSARQGFRRRSQHLRRSDRPGLGTVIQTDSQDAAKLSSSAPLGTNRRCVPKCRVKATSLAQRSPARERTGILWSGNYPNPQNADRLGETSFSALPDNEREVFQPLWYGGMDQKQVAELIGVSLPTVQRRWYRARYHLNTSMSGQQPPFTE